MATKMQLEKVKQAMLITGEHQDKALSLLIDEVVAFLLDAGASHEFIASHDSIGLVTRGVIDLWDYGAGGARLSPYFIQRAIQAVAGRCWDGV